MKPVPDNARKIVKPGRYEQLLRAVQRRGSGDRVINRTKSIPARKIGRKWQMIKGLNRRAWG